MRIVAGQFKGRRIDAPPGRDTRPTADRVREALFSMLPELSGRKALDLFAGSGALGIEALSRGAACSVFVDSDAAAVAAIRRNLSALGLAAEVRRMRALSFLARAQAEARTFDLVFLDPPYSSAGRLGGPLSERLLPVVTEASLIVSESDKRSPLEIAFPLVKERVYGDTRIAIHRGG